MSSSHASKRGHGADLASDEDVIIHGDDARRRLLSMEQEPPSGAGTRSRSRSRDNAIGFPTTVMGESSTLNADHVRSVSAEQAPEILGLRTKFTPQLATVMASPMLPKRSEDGEEDHGDGKAQLTWRSIIVGSLVGGIVCLSNIYFGLKTSITLGSSFTGAILGFACLAVSKSFNRRENCTLTSACNAAGGFAAGYITAIPALSWYGKDFTFVQLLLWTLAAGFLGVFLMPPLRRHMILVQNLVFPSGTATAVVISRLHAAKEKGMEKAKALIIAMVAGFSWVSLSYFIPVLYTVPLFYWIGLPAAQSSGWIVNLSPAFIGSGVFTGLRNCLSMLLGSFIAYGLVGPLAICHAPNDHATALTGACTGGVMEGTYSGGPSFYAQNEWFLWLAIALLFADQLVNISLQYKSFGAAFQFWRKTGDDLEVAPEDQLVPPSWWITGFAASSVLCIFVVSLYFDMKWWEGIIAILFGIPLSIICIQCTGETDTTPTGAVGKMSQLLFAIISPHNPVPNLMAANIASAGATQSTDTMQSFRTGHNLRSSPRAQFIASVAGCFVGVFASMAGWYLFKGLIPQCAPPICTSDQFPAQAAMVWYNAAKVLSQGLSALPPKVLGWAIGALVYGGVMPVVLKFFPKIKPYMPNTLAVSLGLLIGPFLGLAMTAGCLLFMYWEKKYPVSYDDYGIAIASGMVAGEGLAGILQGIFGLVNVPPGLITNWGCYGYPC